MLKEKTGFPFNTGINLSDPGYAPKSPRSAQGSEGMSLVTAFKMFGFWTPALKRAANRQPGSHLRDSQEYILILFKYY